MTQTETRKWRVKKGKRACPCTMFMRQLLLLLYVVSPCVDGSMKWKVEGHPKHVAGITCAYIRTSTRYLTRSVLRVLQ